MTEPSLPEKVVAIEEALSAGGIEHAFGGALALAYYAEPRATIDVDVNVFIAPTHHERVFKALGPLGVERPDDQTALERDGQSRWRWGRTPVDLFFSNDPIHEAMRRATRSVPFGEAEIPILSPSTSPPARSCPTGRRTGSTSSRCSSAPIWTQPRFAAGSTRRWPRTTRGAHASRSSRHARRRGGNQRPGRARARCSSYFLTTLNRATAGSPSTFPAASIALTSKR